MEGKGEEEGEEEGERGKREQGVAGSAGEGGRVNKRKVWTKIKKETGQSRVAPAVSSHHR